MALFYDDIPVGLSFSTPSLDVTAEQIDRFANLSGDFFALHMDDAFARSLGFPCRVAHGLLGLILLDGLKNQSHQRFEAVASLKWDWNFRAPLYPGDRVQGHITVTAKRLTSKANRGILTLALELRNQHGQVLQDGANLLMVRTR
jgi:acyl dehydratase